MWVVLFECVGELLWLVDLFKLNVGSGQILLWVEVCGVCCIDLYLIDGELFDYLLLCIFGYQIVGCIVVLGEGIGIFGLMFGQ